VPDAGVDDEFVVDAGCGQGIADQLPMARIDEGVVSAEEEEEAAGYTGCERQGWCRLAERDFGRGDPPP
jgi:hypothetical protein